MLISTYSTQFTALLKENERNNHIAELLLITIRNADYNVKKSKKQIAKKIHVVKVKKNILGRR